MERQPRTGRERLTDAELAKLIQTIRNTKSYLCNTAGEFLRKRDETIILLAALAGLRPSEVLELKWSDLDFENKRIYIDPWTNKQRESKPAIMCDKDVQWFST